jgi:hypothetical protein
MAHQQNAAYNDKGQLQALHRFGLCTLMSIVRPCSDRIVYSAVDRLLIERIQALALGLSSTMDCGKMDVV